MLLMHLSPATTRAPSRFFASPPSHDKCGGRPYAQPAARRTWQRPSAPRFLIVVEINVNAPALCKLQPAAPLIQGIRTVVTAIASSGTVTPHIDVSRSSNPRRGSVVMIRDAKCNVVVAEQIK